MGIDVKRYHPNDRKDSFVSMVSLPDGDYVKHSDHLAMVRQLEADKVESDFGNDLRHKADMRAIKRWQEATGRDMTWPDHADLCVWLMDKITQLEADNAVIFDGYAVHKKLMEMRPSTTCKLGCLTDVLDAIAAIWKESAPANYGSMKK